MSKSSLRPNQNFVIPEEVIKNTNKVLKEHKLYGDAGYLMNFIRKAMQNREYAKFEFTKSLSDALELIAEAGEMLGFNRQDLCQVDLPTLMKFRNPEKGDLEFAQKVIQQSIDRHRKERHWYDAVILPPVIASTKDFYFIAPYEAKPNFITRKFVKGSLLTFDEIKSGDKNELTEYIVLFENADPGFDWIFAKNPKAIITKYGGIASHISIRCAEFGIPSAIGCGEIIYDRLKRAKVIVLDCEKKTIKPLDYY